MAVRKRLGRTAALIEQDYFRRIVLKEADVPDGANIGLISTTARYALDHGYDVILEGILSARRYAEMLGALRDDHLGESVFYYFEVSLEETLRRHQTRSKASEFSAEDMRGWYRPRDLLPVVLERRVAEESTLTETVSRILNEVYPGLSTESRGSADGTIRR
jgi:hypothetical protein